MEKQSKLDELERQIKAEQMERNKHEGTYLSLIQCPPANQSNVYAEQLKNEHLAEVSDLRQMLSTQEASIECQRTELQQLRQLIPSEREQPRSVKGVTVESKRLSDGTGPGVRSTHLHNITVMTTRYNT